MALTTELDRVAMVVLRYLRRPFFALTLVYAVGIIGMALIPGRDADGNPECTLRAAIESANGSALLDIIEFAIPDSEQNLPGALAARKPQAGTVAYICRGTTCSAPIASLEQLAAELAESQ